MADSSHRRPLIYPGKIWRSKLAMLPNNLHVPGSPTAFQQPWGTMLPGSQRRLNPVVNLDQAKLSAPSSQKGGVDLFKQTLFLPQ